MSYTIAAHFAKICSKHMPQLLLTKPAEIVQEACQVLEKHGCPVKKESKSELYYSSTLCQIVFQAHAPTTFVHIHTCSDKHLGLRGDLGYGGPSAASTDSGYRCL